MCRYFSIVLLLLAGSAQASEALDKQLTNYRIKAAKWEAIRNDAGSCSDPKKMAYFFRESLGLYSVEISENNSRFAEEIAIKEPSCVIKALRNLPLDISTRVYDRYYKEPLYNKGQDFRSISDAIKTGRPDASERRCTVDVELPGNWSMNKAGDQTIYLSPYKFASLTAECTLLPRQLTDTEFAAYIGEEEPDEAPALRAFGKFRGRIWITKKGKGLEWWLKKDLFLVHLMLASNNGPLPGNLESEVSSVASNLKVSRSK